MGIVNVTPDSFYGESRKENLKDVCLQIEKMLFDGADMVDIGAISTRPGAEPVSEEEEKKRLFPILNEVCRQFPTLVVSIDTYRSEIAKEAGNLGAGIINDISGGDMDDNMPETMARLQVPYILMHTRGTPQTMTSMTRYRHFPEDVICELSEKVNRFQRVGLNDIIIDPGFGFAKNIVQNFGMMEKLSAFGIYKHPLLVGISRKKMIYGSLETTPDNALNGTIFLHARALNKGADILRVHDVKEAVECVKLHLLLKETA